jgi:hypothetical protein
MCRSIKVLRRPGELATDDELRGAALQFVRKISGFHKPSKKNQEAFDQAVGEITGASARLLEAICQINPDATPLPDRSAPHAAPAANTPTPQR